MAQPFYLMWYDDNPKMPTANKINEAIHAYIRRFKTQPNVVLVNENDNHSLAQKTDTPQPEGILLREESYIRRNHFWVGVEREEAIL